MNFTLQKKTDFASVLIFYVYPLPTCYPLGLHSFGARNRNKHNYVQSEITAHPSTSIKLVTLPFQLHKIIILTER